MMFSLSRDRKFRRAHALAAALMVTVGCSVAIVSRAQSVATDTSVIIHAGHLLAEPGRPARQNQSIVIEQGRVVAIRDGFASGARVVDLSRYYVLPGLIDLHTHVALPSIDNVATWPMKRPTQVMLMTLPRLKRILDSGFTTVRDLGDSSSITYDLSRAVNEGVIEGPRIVASEPFFGIGTSYMTANTAGFKDELEPFMQGRGACISRDECREAVREEVRRGAGVIKIRLSFLNLIDSDIKSVESAEELRWIIDMAHQLNRTVAVHSPGGASPLPVTAAIEAGADSIEHGPIEPEQIPLMLKRGTKFVPTLNTAKQMIAKYPTHYSRLKASVTRTHRAGVTIGFGSDFPLVPSGQAYGEFLELRDAGLSATDAIKTATVNAAAILEMSNEIGSIAVGRHADVIAVAKDPEQDLTQLGQVLFVMQRGRIVKPLRSATVSGDLSQ